MKKIIIGIFAHPDDEASGPSATFMQQVDAGAELHLICVTGGQHGLNQDNYDYLTGVRMHEWQAAGSAMGAATLYPLGFEDGTLSNNNYHDIADIIEGIVRSVVEQQSDYALELVTFDTNGLTGHLDHIAVSYITSYVFQHLLNRPPAGIMESALAYYCFSRQQLPQPMADYFVYMPCGREDGYINRRVDVSGYFARKQEVMRMHTSQRSDVEMLLALGPEFHATDNFRVVRDLSS